MELHSFSPQTTCDLVAIATNCAHANQLADKTRELCELALRGYFVDLPFKSGTKGPSGKVRRLPAEPESAFDLYHQIEGDWLRV